MNIELIKKKYQDDIEKASHSVSIAEAMNECLWLGDENHNTIYVNPVYERTSGYSLQECIGKPADFCFDEESKKIIASHHRLRKKGSSSQYEATIITKDGKKVPVLVSGAPTESGGTIGIFINLTKIKKLTREKLLSDEIIRNSTEAIVVLDKNRKIKLWNTGAAKIFGYNEQEVLNKSIDIVIPKEEEEANKAILKEVEVKNFLKNFETHRLAKNGDIVDVSVSVRKVTDEKNQFIGYLLMYQDIRHQKQTAFELQKRFDAIQDAYKELGLQRRHLDYVYEILDAATDDTDLEGLAKLIVSSMCLLTKSDGTVLRLYDKAQDSLKLQACFGVNQKWWDKSKIPFKNSLASDAFKIRRPLIINDVDMAAKHFGLKLTKEAQFKTLILIPLFIGDRILGTISLYAKDPAKFRFIETDFLEKMGKQCSLAIYTKTIHSI